jgi:uncharacterized membrane protein
MEWLGGLGAAAVGALITGIFLIVQQRWADKREDARRADEAAERERERNHQLEIMKMERAYALKDAWREDR